MIPPRGRLAAVFAATISTSLLAACGVTSGSVTVPGLQAAACAPGGEAGRALFGIDTVTNQTAQDVVLTQVQLNESDGLTLLGAAMRPMSELVGVGAYHGDPEGIQGGALGPGEAKRLTFGVEAGGDRDQATAEGVTAEFTAADGTRFQVRTCIAIIVVSHAECRDDELKQSALEERTAQRCGPTSPTAP